MVRILNFVFVALAGLSCFAMNHIAEKTRLADIALGKVHRQMAEQTVATEKLQAEWQVVANPMRIQKLAEDHFGLTGTPTVALASLELLPRRGELGAGSPIQTASMLVPVPQPGPQSGTQSGALAMPQTGLHPMAVHSGN